MRRVNSALNAGQLLLWDSGFPGDLFNAGSRKYRNYQPLGFSPGGVGSMAIKQVMARKFFRNQPDTIGSVTWEQRFSQIHFTRLSESRRVRSLLATGTQKGSIRALRA